MPNMIPCPHCNAAGDCAKCAMPDGACSWCGGSGEWGCEPQRREGTSQGEAVRLFEPAPTQITGQLSM